MSVLEIAKETTPEWWTKLSEKQQTSYLQRHPASKMAKAARIDLKEHLAKNPKERAALRSRINKISKNPAKALKKDFDKIDNAYKKLSPKNKAIIEKQTKAALKKGGHKNIMKAIVSTLAVAGALTLGAAIIGSGGLPYVIISARLFSDTKTVVKEVKQRMHDGEPAAKAMFNSVKTTIGSMMRDPKMIAAALMLASRPSKEKAEKPSTDKKVSSEKKQPKRQNAPKKAISKVATK